MRLAVFVVGLVLWFNSAAGQQVADPIGSGDSLVWRMPPTSPNMQMLMAPFMGILPDVGRRSFPDRMWTSVRFPKRRWGAWSS